MSNMPPDLPVFKLRRRKQATGDDLSHQRQMLAGMWGTDTSSRKFDQVPDHALLNSTATYYDLVLALNDY